MIICTCWPSLESDSSSSCFLSLPWVTPISVLIILTFSGIPTVKRQYQSYLLTTLQSVIDNMSKVRIKNHDTRTLQKLGCSGCEFKASPNLAPFLGELIPINCIPLEWVQIWHPCNFPFIWAMVFPLKLNMSMGIGLKFLIIFVSTSSVKQVCWRLEHVYLYLPKYLEAILFALLFLSRLDRL